ncbi:amidohydrolase family protein [Maribellus comscasis]|uniref:Amidohydrolase family protein n=1 Tax=Maribellus comscasis TaxID=2681766 RepID=A0A6I6JT41_9BACT|nr:amidohydrolase family protein [Maribellus comscasis]QGY44399.1 amidohydrolase family protein [Maribellus comscasis]
MRKLSATYIFPGNNAPVKNGILVCENDGTIIEIQQQKENQPEQAGLEFYSGILVPGFVNTHCHLELSHMKGVIPEKTGISDFVKDINRLRHNETKNQEEIVRKTDRKMWANGIAAVGDIANSSVTIPTKLKSKIQYHTFVESFGFHPSRAEKSFSIAQEVKNHFTKNGLSASITPHSPYSVSKPLFKKIRKDAATEKSMLSIHNQESKAEEQFFVDGTGSILHHFKNNLRIDTSFWKATGKSSISSVLKYLPEENHLLLIHNTFTKKKDIENLKKHRSLSNTFFVLCPLSNLYIENQLPPVELFQNENLTICLGTDSLASNHQLSVFAEMLTIQENFPGIHLEEIIRWGCYNGARALKMETQLGSFETGKKPGINLITGIDFKHMKLTGKSKLKRLV